MSKKYITDNIKIDGQLLDGSGSAGTSNQVLVSTATGINWVDGSGSGIIGGPYLPLAGGTMTGNLTLSYAYPRINLTDTNNDSDYSIINNDGSFSIYDVTNASHRLTIASGGNATFAGDVTVTGTDIRTGASNGLNLGDDSNVITIGRTNELWTQKDTDADATLYINYRGYNTGSTRFRSLDIRNGKSEQIALFDGPTKNTIFTGDVGIGTTNPGAKLEVRSDGSAVGGAEIRLQHANNNSTDVVSTLNFANNVGSVAMIQGGTTGANNTGYISFFTDNAGASSEKMRILGNGNVGIGNISPDEKLHITDSSGANIILNSNTGGNNSGVYMSEGADSAPTQNGAYVYYDATGNAFKIATGTTSLIDRLTIARDSGALKLNQYGSGTFTGTATQRLGVDSSGNVIEIPIGSGAIDGSGTAGYIPKWTDSDTLGNSLISESGSIVDINGTIRYDKQIASNFTSGAKAFIAINSGVGAAKYKVYKNTNVTDGYARFKLDRAYDYGSNDQMVQEAIYQRRNTTKNVRFRYDGDITTADDSYLEFYELTDGTVEGWVCVDDYSKCFAEIYYDADTSETYPNPSSGTPTGTLIHSTNPDTSTPNWDSYQGDGYFSGDVGIGTISPGAKLDVVGNGNAIQVRRANGYASIKASSDNGGNLVLDSDSTAGAVFINNYVNRPVYIATGGGNVGIGETSVDARLHITTGSSGLVNQKFESVGSAAWRVGIPASQTYFAFDNANDNLSAPKVVINSSGNVGIGTTTPGDKLTVQDGTITSTDSSGTNYAKLDRFSGLTLKGNGAGTRGVQTPNTDALTLGTNNTERMRITSTGYVGIGTTSPGTPLSVYHATANKIATFFSGDNGGLIQISDNDTTSYVGSEASLTYIGQTASASPNNLIIEAAGNVGIGTISPSGKFNSYISAARQLTHNGNGGDLSIISDNNTTPVFYVKGTGTADLVNVYDNTNEVFTIKDGGNVGIGTTSPDVKLHISKGSIGDYMKVGGDDVDSDRGLLFTSSTTISIGDTHTINARSGNGIIALATGSTERMRITSGGNVGIGTTSPSQKLHVSGNIYATGQAQAANAIMKTYSGYAMFGSNSSTVPVAIGRDAANLDLIINSSGNVGVGTPSPAAKLAVSDSLTQPALLLTSDGGNEQLKIRRYSNNNEQLILGFHSSDYAQIQAVEQGVAYRDLALNPSGGNVGIGTTIPGSELEVDGEITTTTITYPEPGVLDSSAYNGEIVYFGSEISMAAGNLMVLSVSAAGLTWYQAKDSTNSLATGMLGIALGTTASAGLLVRGIAKNSAWSSFSAGEKLYLSPTGGAISNSITVDTNDFVRIVGYALGNSKIYFCPDNAYVQNS